MNAPLPPTATSCAAISEQVLDLTRIFDPEIRLAQWRRPVDRGRLGAGARGLPDQSSGLLGPGSSIEVIPPFAVALLKGSLWQGNGGRGVIHRSPAVTPGETPRVLLAMDADW